MGFTALIRRKWLSIALSLALAGFVILPAFAYMAGFVLTGPYEGEYGVIGYLGSIYADVLAGKWAASVLVATPALIVIVWYIVIRLRSSLLKRALSLDP